MKKIYYLSTCDTCKRIITDLQLKEKGFVFQDIKTDKITNAQLEEMKNLAGSYEALFSRIARKYKELDLASKSLKELDYKNYILEEYTFLKYNFCNLILSTIWTLSLIPCIYGLFG